MISRPEFFLDEVIDGFYVPSMMKRAFAVSLKDYKVLENTCDISGISCSATWGTLLGAVRGGGFIPWDDDIDVEMIREDYMKLYRLDEKELLPDEYNIRDYKTEGDVNLVRKWINSPSMVKEVNKWKEAYGFPFASNIDIMLLDYIPDEGETHDRYMDIVEEIALVLDFLGKDEEEKAKVHIKRIGKILNISISGGASNLTTKVIEQLDEFCMKYSSSTCDRLAQLSYYIITPSRIIPRRLYSRYIDVNFENSTIRVPIGYDGILRRYWGDYMYPNIEFTGHNYPFYDNFEKKLVDIHGIELIHYHYYDDRERVRLTNRIRKETVYHQIEELVPTILEAHRFILNPDSPKQEVLEVLGACQDMAVSIGEIIEDSVSEPQGYVRILEEYCDVIYKVYRFISEQEEEDYISRENLSEEFKKVESIFQELEGVDDQKKEVVFLTCRKGTWKSLHTLWQEADKDEYWNVTVIAIPYYYRDFEFNILSDKPIIDCEDIPKEVKLTSYDKYDFEKKHPDMIVFQQPYDEYSDAFSVHPFFYASNLRQYTDDLVLVPSFILREVTDADQRSRFTLRSYVETPGFVYADNIIAQSENMKKVFTELAENFVKNELGDDVDIENYPWFDWDNKVSGDGSPIYDWISRGYERVVYPDNIKNRLLEADGKRKKVVVFGLSGSMLFEHGIREVERAKEAIKKILCTSENIVVLWCLDPYAEEVLESEIETLKAYKNLILKMKNEDRVIIYEKFNDKMIGQIGDIYYGDASTVMNEMRINLKPVLWKTPGSDLETSLDPGKGIRDYPLLIVYEGEMSLEQFLPEALDYEVELPRDGYASKIWSRRSNAI